MGLIEMDDDVVAPRSRRARNIHKSLKSKDSLVLSYLRVMVWLRVKLRLREQVKTSLAGNILRHPPAIWIVMETCRRKTELLENDVCLSKDRSVEGLLKSYKILTSLRQSETATYTRVFNSPSFLP